MSEHTMPDDHTRAAEDEEADAAHDAGPTGDELTDEAAERARRELEESGEGEEIGERYRDMTERGAHQQGEGKIA